jgi:hypothetical protein
MNIAITEVSSFKETIVAAGIKAILEGAGIPVELGPAVTPAAPAPIAAPSPAPKTRKQLAAPKPPAPKPAPSKTKPAAPDTPRITVRARLEKLLEAGPKTAIQAAKAMCEQGVATDAHLIGQHFYLMVRDGLCERDEAIGGWRKK